MSDISKITLPDASEYNLKDASARADISQLTLYKNSLTTIQRLILPNVFQERKANNSTGFFGLTTPGLSVSTGGVLGSSSEYYTNTLKTAQITLAGSPLLLVLDHPDYRWFGWVYNSNTRSSSTALRKLNVEGSTGYGDGTLPLYYTVESEDVQLSLAFLRVDGADMTTDATDPTSDVYIIQRALHIYILNSARIPIVSWNSTTGVLSLS